MKERYKLNQTRSSRDRLYLLHEGMGGFGDPEDYPTHAWCVVNGVDRGNGYQGYMSVTYALKECKWIDPETKVNLRATLRMLGFGKYVDGLEA